VKSAILGAFALAMSKQLNVGACNFHRPVAPGLVFFDDEFHTAVTRW